MGDRTLASRNGPRTMAIDVGGTGLKASVLDRAGKMLIDQVRVATPYPCPPKILLRTLVDLVAQLPAFDRISVGFPGVVRDGRILTAPHFGDRLWRDFPLAAALSKRLGTPVRLLNDAEVQGFGVVSGRGLEVVLTLGTGAGTAVFRDGVLMPRAELAQHPIHDNHTYNDYIGSNALAREGAKKWSHRVHKTIKILNSLLHYDVLYLGGGNADIHATDGEIGHIADFLVEDADWSIHYLVADTKNWWPRKKVLISPRSVLEIEWLDKLVNLNVDRQRVKDSPAYDASTNVDRAYEKHFHHHYDEIRPSDRP